MTGTEAMRLIRLTRQKQTTFGLVFISATECAIRKIENCRLRSAPVDADGDRLDKQSRRLHHDTDRYLYFTDLDRQLPLQCFRRLIRQVRIDGQWHRIEWFK